MLKTIGRFCSQNVKALPERERGTKLPPRKENKSVVSCTHHLSFQRGVFRACALVSERFESFDSNTTAHALPSSTHIRQAKLSSVKTSSSVANLERFSREMLALRSK